MKQKAERPITELRHPHTVYLVDEVWGALERMHLEARLRSPRAPSKIEFIEEVLRTGMRRMADVTRAVTVEAPVPAAAVETGADEAEVPTLTPTPARRAATPRGAVRMAAPRQKRAEAEPPVATTPPPRRRTSPVERLLQASEPGRPAPIRSVAATDPPGA